MRATELRSGMAVQTSRGVKIVQSSTASSTRLQRISFVDGSVILCPVEAKYIIVRTANAR